MTGSTIRELKRFARLLQTDRFVDPIVKKVLNPTTAGAKERYRKIEQVAKRKEQVMAGDQPDRYRRETMASPEKPSKQQLSQEEQEVERFLIGSHSDEYMAYHNQQLERMGIIEPEGKESGVDRYGAMDRAIAADNTIKSFDVTHADPRMSMTSDVTRQQVAMHNSECGAYLRDLEKQLGSNKAMKARLEKAGEIIGEAYMQFHEQESQHGSTNESIPMTPAQKLLARQIKNLMKKFSDGPPSLANEYGYSKER
jgi:hypothetical protein